MAKIAIAITPQGIETVAFVENKDEAHEFYVLIREDLKFFESQILRAVREKENRRA